MKAWKIAVDDRAAILTDEAVARDTVWRAVAAGAVVCCEAVDVRTDTLPCTTPESPLVQYLLAVPEGVEPTAHCDLCGRPYQSTDDTVRICPRCLDDLGVASPRPVVDARRVRRSS